MTAQDLTEIQTQLDSWLPESYIEFMLSGGSRLKDVFYDQEQIIEANLDVRKKCWRGDPFDRFFYVFGKDECGRVLFMDLDIQGGLVMREDDTSSDPSIRATMLSRSFQQWVATAEQSSADNSATGRASPKSLSQKKSVMKRRATFILTVAALISCACIYWELGTERRKADTIIVAIEDYQRVHGHLPNPSSDEVMKNLGFELRAGWHPDFQVRENGLYRITILEGFDGPYWIYDSLSQTWQKGFP